MISEALTIDVDHQNLDVLPTPFPQLLELLGTRLDRFAANSATRDAQHLGHLRQHFLILSRRNATQQCAQHVLAETAVLPQGFLGGNLHFAFGLVAQSGSLHL